MAGTYSLTITDQGTDTIVKIVTLTQPFPVFRDHHKDRHTYEFFRCRRSTVVPRFGIPPYDFLWSNGDTTTTTSFSKTWPDFCGYNRWFNGCGYTLTAQSSRRRFYRLHFRGNQCGNVLEDPGTARVTRLSRSLLRYTWSSGASTPYVEGLCSRDVQWAE